MNLDIFISFNLIFHSFINKINILKFEKMNGQTEINQPNILFQKTLAEKIAKIKEYEKKSLNLNSPSKKIAHHKNKSVCNSLESPLPLKETQKKYAHHFLNSPQSFHESDTKYLIDKSFEIPSYLEKYEDKEKKGKIQFSSIGQIYQELKLFDFCDDETKLKNFYKNFWSIFTLCNEEDDALRIHNFLEINNILSQTSLPISKSVNLLEDFMEKAFNQSKNEINNRRENKGLWSLEKLVIEYRFLSHGSPKKESETSQNREKNRWEMLFDHSKYLKEKKEMSYAVKYLNDLKEYSFKPNLLSKQSKQNTYNSLNSKKNMDYNIEYNKPENHFELLYNKGQILLEKRKEYLEFNNKLKEEEILNTCTFKPKTNQKNIKNGNNVDHNAKIKGYEENVKRLQSARMEKERIKQIFEEPSLKFPKNKEYYENRDTNFTVPDPFKLSETNKNDNDVIFYVDIDVKLGKTGRIAFHRSDDASCLAKSFAKVYNLNGMQEEKVEKMLNEYINKFYSVQNI